MIPASEHRFVRGLLAAINGWQPSEIDALDWDQMCIDFIIAKKIHAKMNGADQD